jgi:hypothetical protein
MFLFLPNCGRWINLQHVTQALYRGDRIVLHLLDLDGELELGKKDSEIVQDALRAASVKDGAN